MSIEIANILYPDAKPISYWYEKFPRRAAWETVYRVAPSPTWLVHIWNLYPALINHLFHKSDSEKWIKSHYIFRIEDTDEKRAVEWATELLIKVFTEFWIEFTEGITAAQAIWKYGPYIQTHRKEIYDSFAKHLIEIDRAYPCFLSETDLDNIRQEQEARKIMPWIYGEYAKWHFATSEQIKDELTHWHNYVIRLKNNKAPTEKTTIHDNIKWTSVVWAWHYDSVLVKSNGIPVYHLASMADDYLMSVTHVIRWDERFASAPLHQEVISAFWRPEPQRFHLWPLIKIDDETGNKRKISKRKDPEASVWFLLEQWYPTHWIKDFLANIINSWFEERRLQHIHEDMQKFWFTSERMNAAWAAVDMVKMQKICQFYLWSIPSSQIYFHTKQWIENYKSDYQKFFNEKNESYYIKAINIERGWETDPKRFTTYYDVLEHLRIFDAELFEDLDIPALPENTTSYVQKQFLELYIQSLNLEISKEEWFENLKLLGIKLWFASTNAEYKQWWFLWKTWDLAMLLRLTVCRSSKTPDLCETMKILWKDEVSRRIMSVISTL